MSEAVTYDNFIQHIPSEQWGEWMDGYLKDNPVCSSMFDDWIDITFHLPKGEQAQGFLDACLKIMNVAGQQPHAFDTFVLPLVVGEKWERIGQMALNARFLPQDVCNALISPLWSHPQCVNHFVVMNDKVCKGRLWDIHPFMHPKILCSPRLQRKYQLFPTCLHRALNQQYVSEYGQAGFEYLKKYGLIDEENHKIALEIALCMDTPKYLQQLNNVVSINFDQISSLASTYFTSDTKTGAFYSAILEMAPDNSTVAFVFKDSLKRLLYSTRPCPEILSAFERAVTMVQWNTQLIYAVMEQCDNYAIGKCLSLLVDVVPVEHSYLIEEYFNEGGFTVSDEVRAQAQQLTLRRHVATQSSPHPKTPRKL